MSEVPADLLTCRSGVWPNRSASVTTAGIAGSGDREDRIRRAFGRLRMSVLIADSSYRLSALVGLLTYFAYATLNEAWSNPALIGVSAYLYLSTPLYSKLSNWLDGTAARRSGMGTGGRLARFSFQMTENLALLWILVAGQVLSRSGLEGIGGFFATAAWITIVSQGGQYLANWMARRNIGHADRNVVLVISVSAIVTALAVSGVTWIQPAYVTVSLFLGVAIFGAGLVADARGLFARCGATTRQ